jgi:hypothetical protein
MVAFSMAMSTMFTDAKLAAQLGCFLLIVPPALSQYSILAVISDSMTEMVNYRPYYGEVWIQLGYFLPHFTYAIALLEFLVDHGR